MSTGQLASYHNLKSRRDALLRELLPDSDKDLLIHGATPCFQAALTGRDVEIALYDAEFAIERVEQGRAQIAAMVLEAVAVGSSVQ